MGGGTSVGLDNGASISGAVRITTNLSAGGDRRPSPTPRRPQGEVYTPGETSTPGDLHRDRRPEVQPLPRGLEELHRGRRALPDQWENGKWSVSITTWAGRRAEIRQDNKVQSTSVPFGHHAGSMTITIDDVLLRAARR